MLEQSKRRNIYPSLAVILLLATSATLAIAIRPSSAATATTNTGVMIPLYIYPDSTWTAVVQARSTYPTVPILVIINPNNGPGSSSDPTYLAGVKNLQSAGVTVLGYVATGYASNSLSSVESQANLYKTWYNADGIFFDEMSNSVGNENYYSTLNSYVKSHGMTYTMGNPGTSVPSSYIGILDNLCIYESSGYPSLSFISYPGYPKSDFSYIAFGVSYNAAFVTNSFADVGYVYIDNLSGNNPYSTLTSLFLQTEATLSTLDTKSSSTTTTTSSTSTTAITSTTRITTSTTAAADPQLTISSQTTAGSVITGFWTLLYDSTGATLATGYTPIAYSLISGQAYTVEADSYGSCSFAYWQDTGNTSNLRDIAITSNTNLVAIYNCGSTTTTTTTTTTITTTTSKTTAASRSPVTIKVVSVNSLGVRFSGMYVVVKASNGASGAKTLDKGYTTLTFNGLSGTTYTVCVSNYQTNTFSHWGDGNTNSCKTVTPTSNVVMTAYYG
jgi:hypothetical protein